MTGTSTTRQTGHDAKDQRRLWQTETSGPSIYELSLDATVVNRTGPGQS